MKDIVLSGKKISKSFQDGADITPVLRDLDIAVCREDFTVIMGPSGAGKSTLLYALSGMDRITSGQVFYKDREISRYTEQQMAALRSEEFGFVFQQPHLVSNLTLFENVAVAGYLDRTVSGRDVEKRAADLLEKMHVGKAEKRLPSQTSGGEAQRAALARAVINRPSLLFADEPTGALNRHNSDAVLDILTKLHESSQSILMVTHDVRAAARGTRILYLEDGKILDEHSLPAYRPEDEKDRETQLSSWLSDLSW